MYSSLGILWRLSIHVLTIMLVLQCVIFNPKLRNHKIIFDQVKFLMMWQFVILSLHSLFHIYKALPYFSARFCIKRIKMNAVNVHAFCKILDIQLIFVLSKCISSHGISMVNLWCKRYVNFWFYKKLVHILLAVCLKMVSSENKESLCLCWNISMRNVKVECIFFGNTSSMHIAVFLCILHLISFHISQLVWKTAKQLNILFMCFLVQIL